MLSEELEMLIEAAIADGEISEKERALLHRRAQAEGVDVDELDMIIDARIVKMKKEESLARRERLSTARNKVESVRESAVEKFLLNMQTIKSATYTDILDPNAKKSFWDDGIEKDAEEQMEEAIETAVQNFYIPRDRNDFVEALVFLKSRSDKNWKDFDFWSEKRAYESKYKEACEKAKVLFQGDKEIESIIAVNQNEKPQKEGKKKGFFGSLFGK